MCSSYLEMQKEATKLLVCSSWEEASRAAADGSPEQLLRRVVDVEHHGEVLVHGRANGGVRKMRKIKGKLRNKEERVEASCVRGERPRRRRSSGGLRGWFWAAWGLR